MLRAGLAVAAAAAATALAVSARPATTTGRGRCGRTRSGRRSSSRRRGRIEGLTADRRGNLYAPGRGRRTPCPVFRGRRHGAWSATCRRRATRPGSRSGPTGGSTSPTPAASWSCGPMPSAPPTAEVFAAGVPGANGVAFDRRGDLWVSDGGTAQGRVWRIGRDGCRSRCSASSRWPTTPCPAASGATCAGCRPGRSRSPRPAARRRTRSARSTSSPTARVRPRRRRCTSPTPRAARSGASTSTARAACSADRLRHDVHAEHAVPGQRSRPAPVPRRRGRDRARRRRQHLRRRQRAQRDRGRDRRGRRGRVVPQRGRRGPLRNAGPLEFPTSPVLVGRKLCMTNSDGGAARQLPPPRRRRGPEGQLRRAPPRSRASKWCRRVGSTVSSIRSPTATGARASMTTVNEARSSSASRTSSSTRRRRRRRRARRERRRGASIPATTWVSVPSRSTTWTTAGNAGRRA